jgi:hypothetical protein
MPRKPEQEERRPSSLSMIPSFHTCLSRLAHIASFQKPQKLEQVKTRLLPKVESMLGAFLRYPNNPPRLILGGGGLVRWDLKLRGEITFVNLNGEHIEQRSIGKFFRESEIRTDPSHPISDRNLIERSIADWLANVVVHFCGEWKSRFFFLHVSATNGGVAVFGVGKVTGQEFPKVNCSWKDNRGERSHTGQLSTLSS